MTRKRLKATRQPAISSYHNVYTGELLERSPRSRNVVNNELPEVSLQG